MLRKLKRILVKRKLIKWKFAYFLWSQRQWSLGRNSLNGVEFKINQKNYTLTVKCFKNLIFSKHKNSFQVFYICIHDDFRKVETKCFEGHNKFRLCKKIMRIKLEHTHPWSEPIQTIVWKQEFLTVKMHMTLVFPALLNSESDIKKLWF